MNKEETEQMFACGVKPGVIQTLRELNLIEDKPMLAKAHETYGKKNISRWLMNGRIQLYRTGNKIRGKHYVRRSECGTAKLMLNVRNILPQNEIEAGISPVRVKRNKNKHIILNK
jgi:hypothetical protein